MTSASTSVGPPPRSIFARLVRGSILFALVSLALLFAITLAESWNASERSLAAAVDTDMAGLVDIYASGGEAELRRRLADRTALVSIEGRRAHYLLRRPGGEVLAGNVARWPALSPAESERGYLTLASGERVYARATRLSPELDLLVARSYQRDSAAMLRLAGLFLLSAGAIVLALWLIGRRAAGILRRRVAAINDAFRAAERGEQGPLLGEQPSDEIGELAGNSSRAIARVATLARTHRHMSDHIAHEIRTPLTHLDNRLIATLRGLPPGADYAGLEKCREDLKGVVSMLDSLLDIAASESRVGDRSGLGEVDLSALAGDLVDLFSGSAEDAGVTLRSFVEPGVTILGERMQLGRLVSNLLDNALKYVPRGGTVTLKLAAGPVLEVSDDGPGIEPALRPHVFERFRTGGPVKGRSSHGLGLALARAIALRHDLVISLVDSTAGAHFVIRPQGLGEGGAVS
ncbi:MAG TPA: HAMP domain-containing sensor histidine kinase [Croceibacterium sp.]